ncbi:hypothetical protein M6B38_261975 [Iris pallida]|uniref:LAGLIDADG homing endonuclease n=1 Tax=Iris pallida TaxID=29817 RepID=A0AAX6ID71_IRIPA|nr:hypothetical protein M6B38_261975 [Iris pallida]
MDSYDPALQLVKILGEMLYKLGNGNKSSCNIRSQKLEANMRCSTRSYSVQDVQFFDNLSTSDDIRIIFVVTEATRIFFFISTLSTTSMLWYVFSFFFPPKTLPCWI